MSPSPAAPPAPSAVEPPAAEPAAPVPGPAAQVQEYVDSRGHTLAADRRVGVLRGVKLLGLESKNGRVYREAALRSAMSLYDGAKVNVNHPAGDPLAARDYRDRLGVIRNVALRPGEGLFGDLHYNPKHALAEQLAWDAEHAPENVGLSHNVLARTARDGDRIAVEAIDRVRSVDLVADPATTSGLFEQTVPYAEAELAPAAAAESLAAGGSGRPGDAAVAALREEVTRLRRAELVNALLTEHGLAGTPAADATLIAQLAEAADPEDARRLVEGRAELVRRIEASVAAGGPPPVSREATPLGEPPSDVPASTTDFVRAITSR